jgi:hypothetical protein
VIVAVFTTRDRSRIVVALPDPVDRGTNAFSPVPADPLV